MVDDFATKVEPHLKISRVEILHKPEWYVIILSVQHTFLNFGYWSLTGNLSSPSEVKYFVIIANKITRMYKKVEVRACVPTHLFMYLKPWLCQSNPCSSETELPCPKLGFFWNPKYLWLLIFPNITVFQTKNPTYHVWIKSNWVKGRFAVLFRWDLCNWINWRWPRGTATWNTFDFELHWLLQPYNSFFSGHN